MEKKYSAKRGSSPEKIENNLPEFEFPKEVREKYLLASKNRKTAEKTLDRWEREVSDIILKKEKELGKEISEDEADKITLDFFHNRKTVMRKILHDLYYPFNEKKDQPANPEKKEERIEGGDSKNKGISNALRDEIVFYNKKLEEIQKEHERALRELGDVLGAGFEGNLDQIEREEEEIREEIQKREAELKVHAEKFSYGNNTTEVSEEDFEKRSQEMLDKNESKATEEQIEELIATEPTDKQVVVAEPINKQVVATEKRLRERRRLNVVSIDEIVKGAAFRKAEEMVRQLLHNPEEDMESGNSRSRSILNNIWAGFRHPGRLARKVWVRMAENGYRRKYYQETLEQITDNQNLMLELERSYSLGRPLEVIDEDVRRNEHYELLEKIMEEYSNDAVELEEKGNKVSDPTVDFHFQSLIYAYQKSFWEGREWTREQFEKKQRSLINGLRRRGLITDEDFLGTGASILGGQRSEEEVSGRHMYATNLFDVAKDYKEHIGGSIEDISEGERLTDEQKEKLKNHVQATLQLDISLGAKISDIKNKHPQGNSNSFDRAIGWMQSRGGILGRIASNPGSMAILGAAGSDVLRKISLKMVSATALGSAGFLTGAWIPVGAAAISAGVYGAMRRNRDLKNDRAMHQRQRVQGKEYTDFRRNRMEDFQYDVRSATELGLELDAALASSGGNFEKLSEEQKRVVASIFARFKTELARDREYRIMGGANRTVDLITAENAEEGEKYGTSYMSKTDLKIKLYRFLKNNNLINERSEPANNSEFASMSREEMIRYIENIDNADRAFSDYRVRSSLTMGSIAALSGAVSVTAGHEILGKVSEMFSHFHLKIPNSVPQDVVADLKINSNGVIDASKLPQGWKITVDGKGIKLAHEIIQPGKEPRVAGSWDEFVRENGMENNQRVSYQGFKHQGTPPDKGVRAMVENLKNLANNKKLHANSTELMMEFKDAGNGKVVVDVSQMFGKELKDNLAKQGVKMEDVLKKGGKFFLALSADNNPAKDGSQFNPILLEMGKDGTIKIPQNIAKAFFKFDENGHLLQGSGFGLKQFVMDTGIRRPRDGAMIVEGISARYGSLPKMEIPGVDSSTIVEEFPIDIEKPNTWEIFGPAMAGASRWQLEEENKPKEQPSGPAPREPVLRKSAEEPTEEPMGVLTKEQGEGAWDKYKKIFGELDGVLLDVRYKSKKERKYLLGGLTNILKEDKKNERSEIGKNEYQQDRDKIKKIYDSFVKSHPRVKIKLNEFMYCLKKSLTEYFKNKK